MIFISYDRDDVVKATRFVEELELHGLDCWMDKLGILAADGWETKIEAAASSSTMACVLVTNNLMRPGGFVWDTEIRYLAEIETPITFVLLNEIAIEDIQRYSERRKAAGDLRYLIGPAQWARDPVEGAVPDDDAGFGKAIQEIVRALDNALVDAKAKRDLRERDSVFSKLPRVECLLVDDGDVVGTRDEASQSLLLADHIGRPWRRDRWGAASWPFEVVVSPRGDLLALSPEGVGPDASVDFAAGATAVTFWVLRDQPRSFNVILPAGAGRILAAWISGNGRFVQLLCSGASSVQRWSVDPRDGACALVGDVAEVPWVSAVELMVEGAVSRAWIGTDGVLAGSGPVDLLNGLAGSLTEGWRALDLAICDTQVMVAGIRGDREVHLGLGTAATGGNIRWQKRLTFKSPDSVTAVGLGRVLMEKGSLDRFLLTFTPDRSIAGDDGGATTTPGGVRSRSWVASADEIVRSGQTVR